MSQVTIVDFSALQDKRLDYQARGTIRFRTLISVPETDTDKSVCGVAMLEAGDTFALHSHEHPEIYFGLEGEGDVMIDGHPHRLAPGISIFIPGNALHGVSRAKGPLKWVYTFAADRFADIVYKFPHEQKAA